MSNIKFVSTLLLTLFLSLPIRPALAVESYDASKDPALRRGTENWEQSQAGFFIIPGAVIGIVALLLFLNREKAD
jgi:hypothetical protein